MRSQDIVIALKLAIARRPYTYAELANETGMSASQVYTAVDRAARSGFVHKETMSPRLNNILEFVVHGLKYVFPHERLPDQRGIPTAHAAAPLKDHILSEKPVVWPDPEGEVRGEGLAPIHKLVPFAARKDERLYEALALVDALRSGRNREVKLAEQLLKNLLNDGDQRSE
jgi:hypothetical protein